MRVVEYVKQKTSPEIRYILLLFITTRLLLAIVGVSSRIILEPVYGKWHEWNFSKHLWLDIWGVWDTGWYLDIAKNGYSTTLVSDLPKKVGPNQVNLGFFPFYPLLIKGLAFFTKDYFIAGVLISNIALFASSLFLFKLVKKKSGKAIAQRAVKYLFLFPTAFILSGVFSEPLFLALLLVTFYYAKEKNWLVVGICGFFLSLTKSSGVLVFLPLLYEYLRQSRFNLRNIKSNFLYLFLVPLGLLTFMGYTYSVFGDWFAYGHVKSIGWGVGLTNPLPIILGFLLSGNSSLTIIGLFILIEILLLVLFYKKVDPIFLVWAILFLSISLVSGPEVATSIPRFSVVIFPLFILLAKLTKRAYLDSLTTIFLALFQGFLFVYWVNGALIV